MKLLELFAVFFKIGLFTFGGGYGMLPIIQQETLSRGWLDAETLYRYIGICESTPGPIAVNMATFVGSAQAGLAGAACATLGVALPALIITLLQLRTPLFFGPPQWDTEEAGSGKQRTQPAILIYSNSDEEAVPPLLDSIATDPKVQECISYPSLAGRPRTAAEILTLFSSVAGENAPALDENLLKMVYYAHEHPQRNEKYSLKTLQQSAEALQQSGMVPAGKGIDLQAMIRKSFAAGRSLANLRTVSSE